MALLLVLLGVIVWLAFGYAIIGIVLIIVGFILWFTWSGGPYGYSHYRRAPP